MYFFDNERLFSFKLDGEPIDSIKYEKTVTQNGNEKTSVYKFANGLVLTNILKFYPDHGAYEWVNWLENVSDEPTGVISELYDCDITLPLAPDDPIRPGFWLQPRETCTKVFAPQGSVCAPTEFSFPADDHGLGHLKRGMTFEYKSENGRSADGKAPFFNINKMDDGYIFAIGWTGQWISSFSRGDGDFSFKAGIDGVSFKMLPGERFRTCSIVVLPYDCGHDEAQNKFRRLIKDKFSVIGKGKRREKIPFYGLTWGGYTTDELMMRLDDIEKYKLPYDGFWVDAGWYGKDNTPSEESTGQWMWYTGDWTVSPHIHPNGLKDVAKRVHDMGMEFLLWFDPEHVMMGAPVVKEHPEYLLFMGKDSAFLDLGRDDAWEYCFETLSNVIETLGINCYRQDCTCAPLHYWNLYDEADRRGIHQIKHINGFYKLWDALLERFPNLLIDNCASGGRRIDIELMKRSVPLWRSDFQVYSNAYAEDTQLHTQSYSTWIPFSGTGAPCEFDPYEFRSAYCGGMGSRFSMPKVSCVDYEKSGDEIKKYMHEYLSVKEYFYADYYPLTMLNINRDTWCASQYNRPEENDGILQIFRREFSPYKTCQFVLKGLESGAKYVFEDIDGGEPEIWDADVIMSTGYEITVPNQRSAKIIKYRKV